MDFRQLESFLTVTKYNSFSKASRELFLTQPALSNQIKNLEKELRTPLFERRGKTIELTSAGKLFREYAIELIKKKEAALFEVNDLIDKFDGTIEVPCSTVPSETIVPQLITGFLKEYPGVKFKIFGMDSSDVIDSVEEKKYAIGFVGSKPNSDFDYIKVYSDDMVFIGPAAAPLYSDIIRVDDILDLPLIVREEGSSSGNIIYKEFEKYDLTKNDLKIVTITENVHIIRHLVACNAGFAFVPRSSIKPSSNNGNIRIYEIDGLDTNRDFYFIKEKSGLLSPLEAKFSEFVYENTSVHYSER